MAKTQLGKKRGRPVGKKQAPKASHSKASSKGKKFLLNQPALAPISTGSKNHKRRPRIIVTVLGPEDETPKALATSAVGELQTFAITSGTEHAGEDHPVIEIMASAGMLPVPVETEVAAQAISLQQVPSVHKSRWSWLGAPLRAAASLFR